MNMDARLNAYLYKLNEMTQGDPLVQVSMYEVGHALGLDKEEAGQMGEALMMGGQAEMKTLSGGIGITSMGMDQLGVTPVKPAGEDKLSLGTDPVLTDSDRGNLETIMEEIKQGLAKGPCEYPILEGVVMDIKTIEVQMLSLAPKTAIIRECLRSISQTLSARGFSDLSLRVKGMIGA